MTLVTFDKNSIKEFLIQKISQNPNFDYFISNAEGARNLDLILDMIASSTEISSIYAQRSYQESRIDTAIFEENIVARAKELGYRIRRRQSPIINLKYIGENPIQADFSLSFGTVANGNQTYQILPFTNSIIEYGDIIPCYVGNLVYINKIISTLSPFNAELIQIVEPLTEGLGVDDTNVQIFLNSINMALSLFPEDYLVKKQASNYTENKDSAKIFIADFVKKFGIYEFFSTVQSNSIDIYAIETPGLIQDLTVQSLSLSDAVLYQEIVSQGQNAESNDSIAYNSPYMYSLMRRAITESDFVYLLKTYDIIKDVSINDYGGILGVYQITINEVDLENYIIINSIVYSFTNSILAVSINDCYNYLYTELLSSDLVVPSLTTDSSGNVTALILTSNNSRSLLNISCSSNLTFSEITTQVPARSCIGYVRYVLTTTTYGNPPERLTDADYQSIKATLDLYRPVGLSLFFERAYPVDMQIKFLISLDLSKFESGIYNFTLEELKTSVSAFIYQEYDKRVGVRVNTTEVRNRLIQYVNSKFISNVITSIYDFNEFDVLIDKSSYSDINVLIDYTK